jgi:hypothetical protein
MHLFLRASCVRVILLIQVLYLPAGWFHEVFSSAALPETTARVPASANGAIDLLPSAPSPLSSSSSSSSSSSAAHRAFNYWFHPPDGHTFEAPYTSGFWERDFCQRPESRPR